MLPRIILKFTPYDTDCAPFKTCAARDNLTKLIEDLDLKASKDADESGMSCDMAEAPAPKYALVCGDKYEELVNYENEVQSGAAKDQILWIVICLCVVAIICLVINTIRITRKKSGAKRVTRDQSQFE